MTAISAVVWKCFHTCHYLLMEGDHSGICYMEKYHINTTVFPWTCVTRKKVHTDTTANLCTFVTWNEITLTKLLFYGQLLYEKVPHKTDVLWTLFCYTKKDHTNATANLWAFVTQKETTLRTLLSYGHLLAWKQTTLTKFAFYGHCLHEKRPRLLSYRFFFTWNGTTLTKQLLFYGCLLHEKDTTLTKVLFYGQMLHENRPHWQGIYR